MPSKVPALVGAGLALLAFLVVGIHPALVYGTYAGVLLAKGILGPTLQGVFAELLVGFGAALGAVAVSGLFVVMGAIVGTTVGAVFGMFRKRPGDPEDVENPETAAAGPAPEATNVAPDASVPPGEPKAPAPDAANTARGEAA